MAARKRGAARPNTMPEAWKGKIQASMLARRLQDHANGKIEMVATQVRAAEILLRKTVPDLAAVQVSSDQDNPQKIEISWKSG